MTMFSALRACSWVVTATPSHRAASAAKGKDSAGPVRRRRENGTLNEIVAGRAILARRNRFQVGSLIK